MGVRLPRFPDFNQTFDRSHPVRDLWGSVLDVSKHQVDLQTAVPLAGKFKDALGKFISFLQKHLQGQGLDIAKGQSLMEKCKSGQSVLLALGSSSEPDHVNLKTEL